MVASSRLRIGFAALLGTLAIAALLFPLTREGADAASSPGAKQTRYLLRLTDLPPGFAVLPIGAIGAEGGEPTGPDMPCGELDPADPAPPLAAFVRRHRPAGCFAAYLRLYATPVPGPKPFLAGSGVLDVHSAEAAREAFALAPQILSHFLFNDEIPRTLPSPEPVGEESMLVPGEEGIVSGKTSTYLVWRSGGVVGVTMATGKSRAAAKRDALALARLQQAHIEHPTPYTAAERDDAEVALDDPKLERPVYWLGREFAPGNDLPPLRLEASEVDSADDTYQYANLAYSRADGKGISGLHLRVTARKYRRIHGTYLPSRGRCGRTKRIALPRGHAVLYGAYWGSTPTCPKRPPGMYFAEVFVGRAVIGATLEATCAECGGPGGGPYNSFKGMTAIVRGLEARTKRLF